MDSGLYVSDLSGGVDAYSLINCISIFKIPKLFGNVLLLLPAQVFSFILKPIGVTVFAVWALTYVSIGIIILFQPFFL